MKTRSRRPLPRQLLSPKEYGFILRNDPVAFAQWAFHELNPQTQFMPAPHIELIAQHLELCRRGIISRLILNLPPRHLKSHLVSIAFVAFLLGHDSSAQIICASYGQELADKFARDTRALMLTDVYRALFKTRLTDRTAVHDFTTNGGGFRLATSVTGAVTGRGGDYLIIDDPIKPDEGLSETKRKATNDWYDGTLLSRLNSQSTGRIIITMQRVHQDDLVGHVLEKSGWTVLSLPAIAEKEERYLIDGPLGKRTWIRKPGEVLHPARDTIETFNRIRRDIGPYNYSAQYQQDPEPEGGAIIKTEWIRFFEPGGEPASGYIVQSWDTACKSEEIHDFSVCTTWRVVGKDLFLLDVFRRRLNFLDLKQAVLRLRDQFKPYYVIVEDKSSGIQLIQELKGERITVKPYKIPYGADKQMRLYTQSNYFANGQVFLPKGAHWVNDYVAEITRFPGTRHDDQVDSTTQFFDYLSSMPRPLIITPEVLRTVSRPGRWVLEHEPWRLIDMRYGIDPMRNRYKRRRT